LDLSVLRSKKPEGRDLLEGLKMKELVGLK
jgi:hypothetical protein